jgi:hypothetical protein
MPSRPARPQLGLFDNPAGAFRLEELTETVRALERQRPGRVVDELSRAVFAELAMKRTRRSAELIAEAIRQARAREPHAEIAGSRWQASTAEVRNWAQNAGTRSPGREGRRSGRGDPAPGAGSRPDCPGHQRCHDPPDFRCGAGSPGRAGADRRAPRCQQDLARHRRTGPGRQGHPGIHLRWRPGHAPGQMPTAHGVDLSICAAVLIHPVRDLRPWLVTRWGMHPDMVHAGRPG